MNDKAAVINNEIRILSKYRALLLSKYYLTAVLGAISVYLGMKHYAASSLYILIVLQGLPPILTYALKEHYKKPSKKTKKIFQDFPFELNYLKRKYKYSRQNYASESVSYLISGILICLWQINYTNTPGLNLYLHRLPLFTLASALLLRFLAVIIYRLKLPFDLMHNKL